MAGDSRYTPLVGVIGEGEEGRPPHPLRDQLARLLLEHGADPYDLQVGYNIHFKGRVLWWLTLIHERTGSNVEWADPDWRMLRQGGYGTGARWYLDAAIEHNDRELAEWCLAHGANPNAAPGPGRKNKQRSLYDEAMFRGYVELAEVLARHGAKQSTVTPEPLQVLVSAVLREDEPAIRATLAQRPEFVTASAPLFAAAKYNRPRAAALLLDLGTSPNVESGAGERALHIAAYDDSVDVARLLIERGADVDPIGRRYDNTPLGGAMHCQSTRVIELLAGVSRSAWEVMYAGRIDRVRDLVALKPERARATGDGETMLMWLPPTEESLAMEAARLLIENGADPTVRDPNGLTAADRAERNAMFEVAAFLRAPT
jgi:ankyrin repeat protein